MRHIGRVNKNWPENFAGQRRTKTEDRTRSTPKKGKTGCVLGAGEDGNGWGRVRTDGKSPEARRKSWDELVSAAASVGAGRSPQATSAPRHALRRAQPHLVAESFCTLTKNREVSARLTSLFLAGAEGLEPSARGFGVDVGEHTGERERGDVSRSQPQARKRVVLVWCCEVFWQAKAAVKLLLLEGPPPRGRTRIARRGPGRCRRLGRGFRPNPRQPYR